jgi:hypothetical protein
MAAYPIAALVASPKNNDPEIIKPLMALPEQGGKSPNLPGSGIGGNRAGFATAGPIRPNSVPSSSLNGLPFNPVSHRM